MNFNISIDKDFSFKLGAHEIKVYLVDAKHKKLKHEGDYHTEGVYLAEELSIYLLKTNPPSLIFSTFFHELIHAIEHIYTIRIKHTDLNLIGECISQVLIDNFQVKK